jgi:hypothetical protein
LKAKLRMKKNSQNNWYFLLYIYLYVRKVKIHRG